MLVIVDIQLYAHHTHGHTSKKYCVDLNDSLLTNRHNARAIDTEDGKVHRKCKAHGNQPRDVFGSGSKQASLPLSF